ncbi:MAG: hypothetical protein ACU843_15170 [Gammaproteobacteria bacterium]
MKVICELPNASDMISGVKFSSVDGVHISEAISEEMAEHFLKIPGYKESEETIKPSETEDPRPRRGRPPKIDE